MCSFLTVGIEGKRAAALETALLALHLELSREVNPEVKNLFPPGDLLFLVTRGGCSCDLVPPKADTPREEKRRRRGQSGSRRPNQRSDALFAALQTLAPVRLFFQEVSGDQLREPPKAGSQVTLLS